MRNVGHVLQSRDTPMTTRSMGGYVLGRRAMLGGLSAASVVMWAGGPAAAQAPASDWAGILAAARKEGKVTYYSVATQPQVARLVAGFRKAYPDIAIEFLRSTGGEQLTRITQEQAAGLDGADVWTTTEVGWMRSRAKEGKLLAPTGPAAKDWPAAYVYDGAAVIAGIEPRVIAYNKTLVKTPPRTYRDILNPELRGKVGTVEGTSTAFVAFYDWLEKTQGADYLTALKEQRPRLYNGASPLGQAVAAGEIAVSVFNVPSSLRTLIEQGAPIEFVEPNPNLGIQYATGALGWSKRPNAALVLLDYLMTRDAQTAWHGHGDSASPLPDIPGALSAAAITPYDAAAYPPEMVAKYREYWAKIFK